MVAALVGGAIVAGAIALFDLGGGATTTRTVIQQAPVASTQQARSTGDGLTPHDIYMRSSPGVVFVRARIVQEVASPFGLEPEAQPSSATGTGFVIDDDGHILTNYHVVAGASQVTVGFGDEKIVEARLLGTDASNDLALLKVDPDDVDLSPLELGDSSTAQVGDPVLAIGNPFGLDRTLTTGVVSAVDRSITGLTAFQIAGAIQTDAAINPGNSGGPLLDGNGRVIGINSQIATGGGSTGNVGIGFAVPINTAKRLLPDLKRSGAVEHAYLGIIGTSIDARLADLQLRVDRGVLVQSVEPGSGAAKAGLRGGTIESQLEGQRIVLGGDVIQSVDGRPVDSMSDLTAVLSRHDPGDEIKVGVLRGGERRTLTVKLGTAPKQARTQTP